MCMCIRGQANGKKMNKKMGEGEVIIRRDVAGMHITPNTKM